MATVESTTQSDKTVHAKVLRYAHVISGVNARMLRVNGPTSRTRRVSTANRCESSGNDIAVRHVVDAEQFLVFISLRWQLYVVRTIAFPRYRLSTMIERIFLLG